MRRPWPKRSPQRKDVRRRRWRKSRRLWPKTCGDWPLLRDLQKPELQQLAAGLPDVVLSGRADSTTKKYLGAFQRWKVWAESMEIVPSFPVKGMHLALYMQHLSTAKHSRSAVEEVVHALAWMHKMAGIESPMESWFVQSVLEGLRRILSKPKVWNVASHSRSCWADSFPLRC